MTDKQINWYPGHMQKSLNMIKKNRKLFDCICLILDARAPISSFIEEFQILTKDKQLIILINKIDLVPAKQLKTFFDFYQQKYHNVLKISLINRNKSKKEIIKFLEKIPFRKKKPKILILGIPNVGKSTFINTVLVKTKAKVEAKAGVTRELNWYQLKDRYWFLDTPGIHLKNYDNTTSAYHLALIGSFRYEKLPLEELYNYLCEKKGLKMDCETKSISNNNLLQQKLVSFSKGKENKIILDKFEKKD